LRGVRLIANIRLWVIRGCAAIIIFFAAPVGSYLQLPLFRGYPNNGLVWAQSGWRQGDVVTYFDARDLRCVELTEREVVFCSGGGIYRLDRLTAAPIEPWLSGVGREKAILLTNGRLLLWHPNSMTLWLAAGGSLYYYRWDIERWGVVEGFSAAGVHSLGDAGFYIAAEAKDRQTLIDPYLFRALGAPDEKYDTIRWQGQRGWKPHSYPYYQTTDIYLRFNPDDGKISDWEFNDYKPVYDILDENYDRRYICYPGLGVGIANERNLSLEIVQPGPAGSDVKSIVLGSDGLIWVGGDNAKDNDGLSQFARKTGRWKRFGWRLTPGLKSQRVWDATLSADNLYLATDFGLSICRLSDFTIRTLDRFDGLHGAALRALAIADGYLFIGGDYGVNRLSLPAGPVFKSGSKKLDDMKAAQMTSDGDTVWVAGVQGLYRGEPDGRWTFVGGEDVIGDEPARAVFITPRKLFVGGSRGVRVLDRRTGQWSAIPTQAYLGGGGTICFAANDSLLWAGSTGGLYRYNFKHGDWRSYSTNQGLPAVRIQRLMLEADTLWIGTPKGLTRFLWNRPGRDE